jgi:hypothetical protein
MTRTWERKQARVAKQAQLKEQAARIEAAKQATREIVASEKCPKCGGGLKRNLSLTGWWQCEQFGAVGFRKDAAKPACEWQGFTE